MAPITPEPLVAGVELGGTKAIVVLARGGMIVDRVEVPTAAPNATLGALSDAIATWNRVAPIAAIGIASFGPLELNPASAEFGRIVATPKPGWTGADVRGWFARRFAVPVGIDTDVTGAALAEGRWGSAQGCTDHLYVTIGTGVGVGIVSADRPVHGIAHPEAGHVRVRRSPGDTFAGACPFHGDCLEGLVSGVALARRTGLKGNAIPADHVVWGLVAGEIAELMAFMILTLSPERIVVAGGVIDGRPALRTSIREHTHALLGGYVDRGSVAILSQTIVAPGLGRNAGALGAVHLGLEALARVSNNRSGH